MDKRPVGYKVRTVIDSRVRSGSPGPGPLHAKPVHHTRCALPVSQISHTGSAEPCHGPIGKIGLKRLGLAIHCIEPLDLRAEVSSARTERPGLRNWLLTTRRWVGRLSSRQLSWQMSTVTPL